MKNVKLFKVNEGLLSVDLLEDNLEERLLDWLEENHWEMWADLEMWEGGVVCPHDYGDGNCSITFSGDNGIWELEEVKVETL